MFCRNLVFLKKVSCAMTVLWGNKALLFILILAFLFNCLFASWGLPGQWHPDEVVLRSLHMLTDRTLNPEFFAYPSLHLYSIIIFVFIPFIGFNGIANILSGDALLAGISPGIWDLIPELFYWSRILSATFGVATVFLVYLSAKMLFDRSTGLLAALFLSITVGFNGLAHFATVDIPAVFWMMLAFLMTLRVLERDELRRYVIAGFAVGLCSSAKYTGVLMIVPLLLVFVVNQAKCSSAGFIKYIWTPKLLTIFVAAFGGFVVGTPYSILAFRHFVGEFIMLNFYQSTYGGLSESLAFWPHLENLLNIQGIFLFSLSMIGLVYVAVTGWRKRSVGILVLLVSIGTIYLKMGSMHFFPPRYIMPLVPLLAICAGKLAADILSGAFLGSFMGLVRYAFIISGVAFTFIYAATGIFDIYGDDRELARDWLIANVDKNESIEMTKLYGLNIPNEYENFNYLPYYHHKDTFDRMRANPSYLKIKAALPWVRFDDEVSNMLSTKENPAEMGLTALLNRKPSYLILIEGSYERFLVANQDDKTSYPLQREMYQAIIEGSTPYHVVADFRKEFGVLNPELEFINSGVTVYRYR